MTRYRIEEEDDTPDFIVFVEIILGIIFLPIGIIICIVKIFNYFSERSHENEIRKATLKENKAQELFTLASLKENGIITESEFQERKSKIMDKL